MRLAVFCTRIVGGMMSPSGHPDRDNEPKTSVSLCWTRTESPPPLTWILTRAGGRMGDGRTLTC